MATDDFPGPPYPAQPGQLLRLHGSLDITSAGGTQDDIDGDDDEPEGGNAQEREPGFLARDRCDQNEKARQPTEYVVPDLSLDGLKQGNGLDVLKEKALIGFGEAVRGYLQKVIRPGVQTNALERGCSDTW